MSQQQGVDSIALIDICSQEASWLTDTKQPAVHPRWSPDGRYLAFLAQPVRTAFELVSNLWLLDVIPHEFSQITPDPKIGFSDSAIAWDYVWSPDGQEILVSLSDDESLQSAIIRLADRETRVLPEGLFHPFSWSSDGTKIALSMLPPDEITEGDESMLWSNLLVIIQPDGHWVVGHDQGSYFLLHNRTSWQWSPDGQLLAVVAWPESLRGIGGEIELFEIEGDSWILRASLQESLPFVEDYGIHSFDWSPTGKEMAFVLVAPEDLGIMYWGQVQVSDRNLAHMRALTPEGMYCADVQWSPDGSQLVFVCGDGQIGSLWLINADGTDLHRITEPAKGTSDPQWQPLAQP